MNAKQILREKLRKLRKVFETKHKNVSFSPPPELLALFRSAPVVAGYVKAGSEADPAALIAAAHQCGCRIALSAIDDAFALLTFRQWSLGDPLEQAPYNFLQPSHDSPEVIPDLILTPLLGFDRAMNRIGQGGGHYDRAFAANPQALRIGLAWSVQECAALAADPWDVPLDAVLTEKEWIVGPQSRIGRS